MELEGQRELEQIVHEALEQPAAERDAWLARRCGSRTELLAEARSLISHEERSKTFLDEPALFRDPTRIGDYRIVRRLATGGSAVVYEALPESGGEAVALKALRGSLFADERQLTQFRREVRSLGRLRHPAIARLLEACSTEDGQQFFTMELVRGRRLDEYVREAAPARDELLWLFRELCDAVHDAHQCGVIHRDLKPANILVNDEGRPKILDFGLARLVQNGTPRGSTFERTGEVMGTLPYMSPEQSRGRSGRVTAASDVYSLGVVLYELLTGELPFDFSGLMPYEAVGVLCEHEPVRPSVHRPELRGDLEVIVLKALEKDPEQRYRTAAALGADLGRHLDRRPIVARRPGLARRLRAAWAGNRPLAVGTLATMAVLVVFGATNWSKNRELRAEQKLTRAAETTARTESARATAEAERARAVIDLMLETLESAAPPQGAEREVTVREVLDRVAAEIEQRASARPQVREELHATIGRAYFALGRDAEAIQNLSAYVELLEARPAAPALELARGHQELAGPLVRSGDYSRALEHLEHSLALHRELHADDVEVARILQSLGCVLSELGMRERSEARLAEALALGRAQLAERGDAGEVLQLVAEIRLKQGHRPEAEDLLREALALQDGSDERGALREAELRSTLGLLLAEERRFVEAEPFLARALELWRDRLPDEHVALVAARQNLGTLLVELGRYDEARPVLARVLEAWRATGQTHHEDYAATLSTLGAVAAYVGEWEQAERCMREGLETYRNSQSKRADTLANHLGNLAHVLLVLERLDEAEELTREALDLRRATFGPGHPEVTKSLVGMGELRLASGDLAGAEDYFREALDLRRAALPAHHPDLADGANNLAAVLTEKGELEEAEELLRTALGIWQRSLGDDHPSTLLARRNLDEVLALSGRGDAAALGDGARPQNASVKR